MNQPAAPCRGLLIVFEGLDGAGKTTQLERLDDYLRGRGYGVECLREPTDGPWGQKLRRLMLEGRGGVTPQTELEWFLNDRREHVAQRIRPALTRKQIVLLLDLPPAVGWQRLHQRGAPSHFEKLDYLELVARIFNAMDFPYLKRIRADQEPETVQTQIRHEVQALLERHARAED